jgi:hypothetical protein
MLKAATFLFLALLCSARAGGPPPVWLCVGSEEFLQIAAPLVAHRRACGMHVVTATGPAAAAVKACQPRPDYILLLGDEVRGRPPAGSASWRLKSERRTYHGWKDDHPAEFVSDMVLGDFDADGVPDVPVGRIPARTAAEVTAAVEKIVRWESRAPSLSDLTLPVWAGDPGFNSFFRDIALGFLCSQIRQRAPLWAELWILQGDERSPFCGWPLEQPALFNSRLAGGGLVSAMIGHGRAGGWWSMDLAGKKLEYMVKDAASLATAMPSPPHVIFACSTGRFCLPESDCLTESLFRAPGGPVLCVGATEDSHPLTNYYHSTALLKDLDGAEPRFGTLWLNSLRQANATTEPEKEMLVRALEPVIIRKSLTTADIRADHALLYNIMGDPATRVFSPQKLNANITEKGGQWHWKVPQPPPGTRLLVQRRDPLPDFGLTTVAPSKEDGLKRLTEANAKLRFQTVAELAPGTGWSGMTGGPGTLRLVAISARGVWVVAASSQVNRNPE